MAEVDAIICLTCAWQDCKELSARPLTFECELCFHLKHHLITCGSHKHRSRRKNNLKHFFFLILPFLQCIKTLDKSKMSG